MRARLWLVVSIALLATAGVLLWLAYTNAAFVVAALGVCAWFFDVRMNLKRRHDLVKLSGRNWVPRGELEEMEDGED
jgi:N6-adenosine-specific RNA methylase IME4